MQIGSTAWLSRGVEEDDQDLHIPPDFSSIVFRMKPYRVLLLIISSLAVLAATSGCDSEALPEGDAYRVTITSESGIRVSRGMLYLTYQPPTHGFCEALWCPNEEAVGVWMWDTELVPGQTSGDVFGTINYYGRVEFRLDACSPDSRCGVYLKGHFTQGRYGDFKGTVLERGETGYRDNGLVFTAVLN